MGNSGRKPYGSTRVVIIGFSFAGLQIASMLWDQFDVVVIDKNDYFDNVCSGAKCLVDPDWNKEILFPFAEMEKAYESKYRFV